MILLLSSKKDGNDGCSGGKGRVEKKRNYKLMIETKINMEYYEYFNILIY